MTDVDRMLDGPRFRTLCLAIAQDRDAGVSSAVRAIEQAVPESYARLDRIRPPVELVEALVARLDAVRADAVERWTDPLALFPALGAAVDSAMPWQEPFVADAITELPVIRRALRPIGRAVLRAPAAAWWNTTVELGAQWVVRPVRDHAPAPLPAARSMQAVVSTWRRNHVAEETRSVERGPVSSAAGGDWWSTPVNFGDEPAFLPTSSRRIARLGAVALAVEEDGFGDDEALLHRLGPGPGPEARVFEVHTPEDWVTLVGRYPIAARWSRRGVWWQSTGLEADWLLPDYEAVAEDWDAVHVSVRGYLSAAGRALAVPTLTPSALDDGFATVLAGWAPDETSWLTDAVTIDAEPERWTRPGAEMHEWVRADGRL